MACPLTQGFQLADCEYGAGGIQEVYIIEFSNLVSLTQASCLVSAIDVGANSFYKYDWAEQLPASMETTEVRDEAAGTLFYESVLGFQLKGLDADKCAEIRLLALNRLIIIVKTNEDKYFIIGTERGAKKFGGTNSASTGAGFSEFSGYNLGFTDRSTQEGALEVDSSVIAGLTIA